MYRRASLQHQRHSLQRKRLQARELTQSLREACQPAVEDEKLPENPAGGKDFAEVLFVQLHRQVAKMKDLQLFTRGNEPRAAACVQRSHS